MANSPENVPFGKRLKELRQQKGLSQSELSRRTGIPQNTICRWEKGTTHPNWLAVLSLSRALGVTCEAFTSAEPGGSSRLTPVLAPT